MTGNDLFAISASYLSQSAADSEDIAEFVPYWLNVLLAETLPTENQLRAMDGRPALERAPFITQETMGEEIPYTERLMRVALPYGLASDMLRDDDNDYRCQDFRQKYVLALSDVLQAKAEPIQDCY